MAENTPFHSEIDSSMYGIDKTPSLKNQRLNRGFDHDEPSLSSIAERGPSGASRFAVSLFIVLFFCY